MPNAALPTARPRRAVDAATLRWRSLRDAPLSGARNMAIDHALAECLGPGEAVLRLYTWERPTLSLGRNEPSAPYVDAGFDVVRRPTGGRAVLHDRELTYAIIAPLGAWGGVRETYRLVNEGLARALRSLGAPVEVVAGASTLGPDAGPCFQVPAAGEVVARGRKLVGSAQARIGPALLQHGSILLAGEQRLPGADDDATGAITLSDLVADVGIDEVAEAVARSLAEALGGARAEAAADGRLTAAERAAADRLERERYGRDSWTWRR